ncbi:hypothetical protein ACFL35_16885 [Candidatus Riflebacteria bacterium]
MKKAVYFIVLILLAFPGMACFKAKKKAADTQARYQLKSGIIKFKLKGVFEGTKTLYFDRWGMREAHYETRKMELSGQQKANKEKTLNLSDGKWFYSINLNKKTGIKNKKVLTPIKNIDADMKRYRAKKTGSGSILGRKCDIWEINMKMAKNKTWMWKNIPLKTVVKTMGKTMSTAAIKIEENVVIPEDKFKIPAGIKITSMEEMMKKMKNLGKKK